MYFVQFFPKVFEVFSFGFTKKKSKKSPGNHKSEVTRNLTTEGAARTAAE